MKYLDCHAMACKQTLDYVEVKSSVPSMPSILYNFHTYII